MTFVRLVFCDLHLVFVLVFEFEISICICACILYLKCEKSKTVCMTFVRLGLGRDPALISCPSQPLGVSSTGYFRSSITMGVVQGTHRITMQVVQL